MSRRLRRLGAVEAAPRIVRLRQLGWSSIQDRPFHAVASAALCFVEGRVRSVEKRAFVIVGRNDGGNANADGTQQDERRDYQERQKTLPAKLGAILSTNEWKSVFPSKPIRLEHGATTARVELADGEEQIM